MQQGFEPGQAQDRTERRDVRENRRLLLEVTQPATVQAEQKLVQLQQAYENEILTRAEYERKRKALLASAQATRPPTALNESGILTLYP